MSQTVSVSITLSEDEKTATIRMGSRQSPIVTGCLGVERDGKGNIKKAYLNSLVHRGGKGIRYEGYSLSGAISTIATAVD